MMMLMVVMMITIRHQKDAYKREEEGGFSCLIILYCTPR